MLQSVYRGRFLRQCRHAEGSQRLAIGGGVGGVRVVSAWCNEIWKGGGREGGKEGGGRDRKRPGDVCVYMYIYRERESCCICGVTHAHA